MVIGEEVGESGTPHLQGFITFKRSYRLAALKKLFPTCHWEPSKTTDAGNYCMKEKYVVEDNRAQGKRTDLALVVETAKSGGLAMCVEQHPTAFIKYHGGIEKFCYYIAAACAFKPRVVWIHGPTGVGKTRAVVESEPDLWISGKSLRWWDGYHNQEAVLFDDFRRDFCTFHELLRILDRYPYSVEVKGGYRQLNSKRMYITSCFKPDDVYETREDIGQLMRRISAVILKTKDECILLPKN